MTKEEMSEVLVTTAVAIDYCVESLKEKDHDLNLTGKFKKCYDYLAEQFIRNYIDGKNMFTVMDDIASGKFYNTWLVFLGIARHIVEDGGKFHGIEDIINHSDISRKTWVKFFEFLPKR